MKTPKKQEKKKVVRRKRCPECHELKPAGEVYERVDPYMSELYDDNRLVLMCDDCTHERAMDI